MPGSGGRAGNLETLGANDGQTRPRLGYADYGCRVNAWTVEQLFERYASTRFLYADKAARLQPYLSEILENWRRGLRGGELIHWVATYDDPGGGWATISSWRSTWTGWQTQHLVSTAGPVGSRAVMLAGQAVRIADGWDESHQDWFRRSNRFAAAMFGTFTDKLGRDQAGLIEYELLSVPLPVLDSAARGHCAIPVRDANDGVSARIATFVGLVRGSVYATAEELNRPDLELENVDRLYRLVGLRRYRRIWMVTDGTELLGVALCYRGPLGFNFSLLENRCDLVIHPTLPRGQMDAVVRALLVAAQSAYRDISTRCIPVVTDAATARAVVALGAEQVRSYCQSIWLKSAFPAWYEHVDGLYEQRLAPVTQP